MIYATPPGLLRILPAPSPASDRRKHLKNTKESSKPNFEMRHRPNARTHAQAETANRLRSACSPRNKPRKSQNSINVYFSDFLIGSGYSSIFSRGYITGEFF